MEKKTLITPVFRVAFPHVFEPNKIGRNNEQLPKEKWRYSINMIFPKEFKDAKEKARMDDIKRAIQAAMMEKWPNNNKRKAVMASEGFRKTFRDGDKKVSQETGEVYEGFEESVYTTAKSKFKPDINDLKGRDLTEEEFYAGCYARASVNVFAFDNEGQGVSIGLNNLLKVKDGERLGGSGRTDIKEDFAEFLDIEPNEFDEFIDNEEREEKREESSDDDLI